MITTNKVRITFDKNKAVKDFVLDAFSKAEDESGYVVEKDNPKQKVLTPDGDELHYKDFAGLKKGSEVYIKSDLVSLVKLAGELV